MKNGWRKVSHNLLFENKFGYKLWKDNVILLSGKRELKEELGATGKKWVNLGWAWQVPGFIKLKSYFFLVLDITPGKQDTEETEDLEILSASQGDVKSMLKKMVICDSSSIIPPYKALDYLKKRNNRSGLCDRCRARTCHLPHVKRTLCQLS